jgi:hypothetical protein
MLLLPLPPWPLLLFLAVGDLIVGVEMLGHSLVIRDTRSARVVGKFNYSWTFCFIFYGYDSKNIYKRIVLRF